MPKRLNSRWPMAVRFAATFPLMEARSGVMVVPILLPSTTAHARSNEIHPFVHMMSTMANVAADDCMIAVMTMPTTRKSNTDPKPMEA